jgi:hypothetical protein
MITHSQVSADPDPLCGVAELLGRGVGFGAALCVTDGRALGVADGLAVADGLPLAGELALLLVMLMLRLGDRLPIAWPMLPDPHPAARNPAMTAAIRPARRLARRVAGFLRGVPVQPGPALRSGTAAPGRQDRPDEPQDRDEEADQAEDPMTLAEAHDGHGDQQDQVQDAQPDPEDPVCHAANIHPPRPLRSTRRG